MATVSTVQTVPGRACGSCNLCCKVYDGPYPGKAAGQWCKHCTPGQGCVIHDERPQSCADFFCLWMMVSTFGPEWKPEQARFVMTIDPATEFLLVQVDPGHRDAWKKEPYYRQLKQWAIAGIDRGKQVIVFHNKAAIVVLPDKDVDLGVLAPGERLVVTRQPRVGGGFHFDASKVAAEG
jgi:hypothetical protein